MKKSIWLAIIGAAALAGCQNEVMQQREYVPAPREDVGPAATVPVTDNSDIPVSQEVEPSRANQNAQLPAPQELPKMTQNFGNDGVDENAPTVGKGGKKGAKGVKCGNTAAGPGEYLVKAGDTPEKIARKHHVRLSDLMEANNLTNESAKRLKVGQKLVIPAKSAAGKGGRKGAGAQAKPVPTAGPGEYIVKSGDNPDKIARKHRVRVADLLAANNLTEESAKQLQIGQKLVIPAKGAAAKKGGAAAQPKSAAPAPKKDQKAARPARDLEEDDNAPAPAPVKLNRVEVDDGYAVDVPKDMTVEEFANLAGVPVAKLRELNPDMPAKQLTKGSTFIIPKN